MIATDTRTPYDDIQDRKRDTGSTIPKLLAQARSNDPFCVGSAGQVEWAKWFMGVYERIGEEVIYTRRAHYACASWADTLKPDGTLYRNTATCGSQMAAASKYARYLGYIPFANVHDQKNPRPDINAHYPPYGFGEPNAQYSVHVPDLKYPRTSIGRLYGDGNHGFNPTSVQPYHLEVWCEKAAMNDVILPVCAEYGANFVHGEGELSVSQSWELHQRLKRAGKPARIFYISDFDPGGQSMPVSVARRAEWFREYESGGYDIKLCALVLTHDQVCEYDLPPIPMKTEKSKSYRTRATKFQEKHSVSGATELDALEALHKGSLSEILDGALSPYWSQDADDELNRLEDELTTAVDDGVEAIMDEYRAALDRLAPMVAKLNAFEVDDIEQYEPDLATEDDVEGDAAGFDWLYDSDRDYMEQIEMYRKHGE